MTEYTPANAKGVEVKIITYGGIITSVRQPDRVGRMGARRWGPPGGEYLQEVG